MNKEKTRLHPRNKNREAYDLIALVKANPELKKHISQNKFGVDSINFSNPVAVRLLNKAILTHYYGIKNWDFSAKNLCPPIPGRADYIHHIADLLGGNISNRIPKGNKITCLDIGAGASCIYPIIGVIEYNWNFIGSDINAESIAVAEKIIESNESLKNKIELRLQNNSANIFEGILNNDHKIDITICHPPFHSSVEAALKGTQRKIKNLTGKEVQSPQLNFSGVQHELVCEGGEFNFIQHMIVESAKISKNCYWFSTLVSKHSHLNKFCKSLKKHKAHNFKTIQMVTSNKSSQILAWTFLTKKEQDEWRETRWKAFRVAPVSV